MLSRLRCLAAFMLLLPYTVSFAQGVAELIKSPPAPETLDVQSLPADFRAVSLKLTGSDGYSTMREMMLPMMMMGGSSSSSRGDQESFALFEMMQVSWTNGQTIKTETGEFVVTYRLGFDPMLADQRSAAPPAKLRLALVRKDSIVEISPRPDLTRERLAELLMPPSQRPKAISGLKADALSNFKQLALGQIMYCADNDDITPYAQDTKTVFAVIQPYLKNSTVYRSLNPSGSRILFNMAVSGVDQSAIEAPAETILFYDPTPWPDGMRLVAFADGHVKFVDDEAWRRVEKSLHLKLKHKGKPLPPNYWKKIAPGLDLGDRLDA